MSVVIDHESIRRQLVEIEAAERDREHAGDLHRRRAIQGLSAVGLLSAGARELYRREVLEALPTARYRVGVDSQPWHTTLHPMPDSLTSGVASTAAHVAAAALSGFGGERRAQERPWVSIASAGFLAISAVAAGRRLVGQLEDGELDVFTTLDAVASAAALPLALPEAMRAIRGLLRR
ncbi:hypothetical protein FIV42_27250 [Persicimonas caeni]|uniref:Uncharacterized protein n=1 Tax=Persicimonas caeni TaxID=2292766 RepID=A0A4Y6Q153_PERCE|nr:hypothetical protein [Persicimonas caeni]QDG54308.1 hypothetical protein FIV42_27250 [Persicimonas caeni]QED35529.1 hypothetical protein FRD00_27245 [Persicimonas caeni]